jgi:hypothetical protein
METWNHGNMNIWKDGDIKRKTEAQLIFLNLFTVCLSCKRMFVVYPFVDEETNRSYPFENKDLPIYSVLISGTLRAQ